LILVTRLWGQGKDLAETVTHNVNHKNERDSDVKNAAKMYVRKYSLDVFSDEGGFTCLIRPIKSYDSFI